MSEAPKRTIISKAFALFAVGLLLGIGLCGLDYFLASRGIGKNTEEFGVGPLDGPSLITMAISALGLLITVVAWLLSLLIGVLSKEAPDTEPTRSFDKDDE